MKRKKKKKKEMTMRMSRRMTRSQEESPLLQTDPDSMIPLLILLLSITTAAAPVSAILERQPLQPLLQQR